MKKEMESFLLAAYFGDTTDSLIDVCIDKAFGDCFRKIPYFHSTSKLDKMKNKDTKNNFIKLKKTFRTEVSALIKKQIESGNKPLFIIDEVYKKANSYDGLYIKGKKFYYGLAQKWVNMTFKYLWLFDKCPIDERKLHAPLDSVIIHAITLGTANNKYGMSLNIDGLSEVKWSYLDDRKLYLKIQASINRSKASSLDSRIKWENVAWIEQSKTDKSKSE